MERPLKVESNQELINMNLMNLI